MKQFSIQTNKKQEMINIDHLVQQGIQEFGIQNGIITVFCPHTTAGITINENADPAVQQDILRRLDKLAPDDSTDQHAEGNSDAHLKSSLIGVSVQIPVMGGKMQFGQWQSVYFCEFDGPRARRICII